MPTHTTTPGINLPPTAPRWHVGQMLASLASAWVQLPLFARYCLIVVGLRGWWLGDPLFHTDEQFYLLVAERMRDGALPYVDIWDRKPVGLFLIYRVAAAWRGHELIASQVLALLAAAATATVLTACARRHAGPTGAELAGLVYLLACGMFNCGMGETPVFFNLPMMMAGSYVLRRCRADPSGPGWWRGAGTMLLVGLAIQIKYTALFEGIGFGVLLLAAEQRRHRSGAAGSLLRTVGIGGGWAMVAVLPTLAAWGTFAALGAGPAFVEANFVSLLHRTQDIGEACLRLSTITLALLPLIAAAVVAPWGGAGALARRPLLAWMAFAVVGFLAIGTWYDHYAVPLLMPLCLLAAPTFDGLTAEARRVRALVLAGTGAAGLIVPLAQWHHFGSAPDLARATAVIAPVLRADAGAPRAPCLYVFEGDVALYTATHSCVPTRWAFPAHLATIYEAKALGIDPAAEVRRIFATAPAAVVVDASATPYAPNPVTHREVRRQLAAHYHPLATIKMGDRPFLVYARRRAGVP